MNRPCKGRSRSGAARHSNGPYMAEAPGDAIPSPSGWAVGYGTFGAKPANSETQLLSRNDAVGICSSGLRPPILQRRHTPTVIDRRLSIGDGVRFSHFAQPAAEWSPVV